MNGYGHGTSSMPLNWWTRKRVRYGDGHCSLGWIRGGVRNSSGCSKQQRIRRRAPRGRSPSPSPGGRSFCWGRVARLGSLWLMDLSPLIPPSCWQACFCSIEADRLQSTEWKARKKAYQEEMARWQKHSQPGQAKRTRSERIQREGVGEEPVWDPFPDISGLPGLQTVGRMCQTEQAAL
jgi:hypothetical protein